MNIMLCGANDIEDVILPAFYSVSKDLGFQALNFMNGNIVYHNYGMNKWERNSKLTVHSADILTFIINSKFGNITWNTEFEEALSNGKNFIVLCNQKTYQLYRQLVDNNLLPGDNAENNNIKLICELIQKLEIEYQITIITFNSEDFKSVFKKQLLTLFKYGIDLAEKENRKNSFMPVLLSSKFNDFPEKLINQQNDNICKEILFDFFEKKEIRKRAMDYFFISKSLSEDEIIELCLDPEQGVNRKAVANLNLLISDKHDIDVIFNEIIPSIANEEIGVVRRAVVAFCDLNLGKAIEYFHYFFPNSDVGVARRMILKFYDKKDDLKTLLINNNDLKDKFITLINLCLNYNSDKTPWKEQARSLLLEIE